MDLIITVLLIESVLFIMLGEVKLSEREVLLKWKKGEFNYEELLSLKSHGLIHVRKLNKNIKIGKKPEGSKKDD
jgi:hypothetical protein